MILTVSLLSLVFSVLGAYGLSRFNIRGKNTIILGIFSTQMFPQVLLIIPMYLIVFSMRMLDTVLGVVVGQLILVLPFSIWMLKGYFDGIPVNIDDAARIDVSGAGTLLARRVRVPPPPAAKQAATPTIR